MSEYQFYDFRAIDRPLSAAAMSELGRVSSRATITPTSFVNSYNWGDFRGDPAKLVAKHFDAFLYLSNWGSRELMLKVPKSVLELDGVRRYLEGKAPVLRVKGPSATLALEADEVDGEYDEEGCLSEILPVRTELLRGDLRCLYLGWLSRLQSNLVDPDEEEPDCPAGLSQLSEGLEFFVDFLGIDTELVAIAAERSARMVRVSTKGLAKAIAELPLKRKNELLVRLASEEDPSALREEVLRLLPRPERSKTPSGKRRTAGELLERARLMVN